MDIINLIGTLCASYLLTNMRKLSFFLTATIVTIFAIVSCGTPRQAASGLSDDIVIIYENDVHCNVDGYAALAALKRDYLKSHKFVSVVSSGDYVQGGSLGAASRGRNIITIMNEVGYDFVTLGNHEFDYGIPRQQELMEYLVGTCLCCNLKDLRTGAFPYKSYEIVDYDGVKIAFVGMSTPYAINSSNPSYFKDEEGNYIYSFCIADFYDVVQNAVNSARAEGAQHVVVLSHLGDEPEGENGVNSLSMIENTYGIDVVLDGHSHSLIPCSLITNKKGENVMLTSTGTKLENIGVLTYHRSGYFSTMVVPSSTITNLEPGTLKVVEEIKEGYKKVAEKVVCTSVTKLVQKDEAGTQIVRNQEAPIGNFCADAYRTILNTDVAFINGGGIRAGLPQGNITFNDIYTMFPFENLAATADITGATLMDLLEMSVSLAPGEYGGFMQVAGMKFEYDPTIPSPIVYDADHNFAGVKGERRVKSVSVMDRTSGEYLPLDLQKTYTVAAPQYIIVDHGDGYSMTKECTNVNDTGTLDTDIIETYLTEYLGSVIGEKYSQCEGRIKTTK